MHQLHGLYRTTSRIGTSSVARSALLKRSTRLPNYTTTRTMAAQPDIENTNIKTAAGVTLTDRQKTLVGSVLDLFAGRPSLQKLQLWDDNAKFEDPLTIAVGRAKYEPQWYGLQTAFSEIERLHHEVTSSGNPITMDLKSRYVVKGVNHEQTISSKIEIAYDEASGKITRVADKWNGELPEGAFKDAMRKLNAVTVPKVVSVPKSDEEDAQRLGKQ